MAPDKAGGPQPGRGPRILVISLSDLAMDARVLRQVDFLSDYDVVVAAFGAAPPLNDVDFIELSSAPPRQGVEPAARAALRIAGRYKRAYWLDARVRLWRTQLMKVLPVQAIIVNDLFALPLARAVGGSVPLIFDAHEHWTSESATWTKVQRLSMRGAHEWLVDRHVPSTAAMMTVSPGLARDFQQRTRASPSLVTNAPRFRELRPSDVTEPIRLFHVGVADERRRLEETVEAVRSLEGRFAFDMVLARQNEYRRRLERLVASAPNIRVLSPVAQENLIAFANGYDVGVHLFPAQHPNQVHSLPNKLFDYIQARLAVAIGPSPAMAEVVQEWDCGIVSSSFKPAAFADSLSRLTLEEVQRLKRNADRAAHALTAESNRETVVSLVSNVIGPARELPSQTSSGESRSR